VRRLLTAAVAGLLGWACSSGGDARTDGPGCVSDCFGLTNAECAGARRCEKGTRCQVSAFGTCEASKVVATCDEVAQTGCAAGERCEYACEDDVPTFRCRTEATPARAFCATGADCGARRCETERILCGDHQVALSVCR
jgi:hypothetical protein